MNTKTSKNSVKHVHIADCDLPVLINDIEQKNQKRICKINGELIRGYNFTSDITNAITIFGSSRSTENSKYYQEAVELGGLLAKESFTVITGGGPGIMEAANRGALESGGQSIGMNIEISKHQPQNTYVTKSISFDYFFARKLMMVSASTGYVFFPGGFGTLDEFFEVMNLQETRKLGKKPLIVVVGKQYWQPLLDWLRGDVGKKHASISDEDLDSIQLADSPKEALDIIKSFKP